MTYEAAIEELEYEVSLKERYLAEAEERIAVLKEQISSSKVYRDTLEADIAEFKEAIMKLKGE